MKFVFLILALLPFASAHGKFARVLVLNGGGFQIGQFLGVIDALDKAHHWKPDLVITTCGSSFAGVLIQAVENAKDRLELLKGSDFHKEMLRIKLRETPATGFVLAAKVASLTAQSVSEHPVLPIADLFSANSILDVPSDFGPAVAREAFSDSKKVRLIIVGSRLNFGPEDVGKSPLGREFALYNETYYTDRSTAESLAGKKSAIHAWAPKSAVAEETIVDTDTTLGTAARISASDPGYLDPVKVGNTWYAGAFINLFPVELALELGDEVVALRTGEFDAVEQVALAAAAGYDGNKRQQHVFKLGDKPENRGRLKWITLDGQDVMYKASGMNPIIEKREPWKTWVTLNVPKDPGKYATRIQEQYDWALQRASRKLE